MLREIGNNYASQFRWFDMIIFIREPLENLRNMVRKENVFRVRRVVIRYLSIV